MFKDPLLATRSPPLDSRPASRPASRPSSPVGGSGASSINARQPEASLAEQNAECAVCFDPLHAAPCALFRCGSFRTCRHFLHEACARSLPFPECPLCRCAFDTVQPLPPLLSDPAGWFRAVDTGGEAAGHAARLSRPQVVEALLAQLPLEQRSLEAEFDRRWDGWASPSTEAPGGRAAPETPPRHFLKTPPRHLLGPGRRAALRGVRGARQRRAGAGALGACEEEAGVANSVH